MRSTLVLILVVFHCYAGYSQAIYKFIGDGNWSDTANWQNHLIPPDILLEDAEITIDPIATGACIQDIPLFFSSSVKLIVASGKKFVLKNEFAISAAQDTFYLTNDDLYVLDSISNFDYTKVQVIGPTQKTAGLKDNMISKMLNYAKLLSDKKSTKDPANLFVGDPNNPHIPSHYGYAYRWGTDKDISVRHYANGRGSDATHRADFVVGTDCEGFIWNLLKHVNITMLPASSRLFANSLNKQLQSATNSNFNDLRLDSLGVVGEASLKSGDIILWNGKGHIGIISVDPSDQKMYVYNSNGNPTPETRQTEKRPKTKPPTYYTIAEEQALNYGSGRGIHPILYKDAIDWFKTENIPAIIFRFETVQVTTSPVMMLSENTARAGGSLVYTGSDEVIARGVCWNEKGKPKLGTDYSVSSDEVKPDYTCLLSDLTKGKVYQLRAYVTIRYKGQQQSDNDITYYGNEVSFTAQACVAPQSIDGYTLLGTFNGHMYFLSNAATTWTQARTNATALGGHLLTVNSAQENNFIAMATSVQAWIGLTDEQSEGNFKWVTGEPITYTNWDPNEPNNSGGEENYVIINWFQGNWNDLANRWSMKYIVEFECSN